MDGQARDDGIDTEVSADRDVYARALAREHCAVRALVSEIGVELDGDRALPCDANGFDAALGLLLPLRDHLERHFQYEQRCVNPIVGGLGPEVEGAAAALMGEHAELLIDLQATIERLSARRHDCSVLPHEYGGEVRSFLDRLADHEHRENALFTRRADAGIVSLEDT